MLLITSHFILWLLQTSCSIFVDVACHNHSRGVFYACCAISMHITVILVVMLKSKNLMCPILPLNKNYLETKNYLEVPEWQDNSWSGNCWKPSLIGFFSGCQCPPWTMFLALTLISPVQLQIKNPFLISSLLLLQQERGGMKMDTDWDSGGQRYSTKSDLLLVVTYCYKVSIFVYNMRDYRYNSFTSKRLLKTQQSLNWCDVVRHQSRQRG